jgi:hypothetical protein
MEGVVATWGAVGLLLRDQKGSATEGGEGGAWRAAEVQQSGWPAAG